MSPPRQTVGSPVFPAKGLPRTERDLSFPRRKPRWITLALLYRLMRLARSLLGDRRVLRLMLNANWVSWRFAYEICMEALGPSFRNTTHCVSEELLRRWIPPGGSVLDIGCGDGRLCQITGRFAARVVGIDYDENLVARARRENTRANIEFRVGDVTTALPGEQFDLALVVHVIEHIQDVDSLLRSVRVVTAKLVVEVPDFDADSLNLVRRDLGCVWYTDADHVREYTQSILREQLERNGWRPLEWERRGGSMLALSERVDR